MVGLTSSCQQPRAAVSAGTAGPDDVASVTGRLFDGERATSSDAGRRHRDRSSVRSGAVRRGVRHGAAGIGRTCGCRMVEHLLTSALGTAVPVEAGLSAGVFSGRTRPRPAGSTGSCARRPPAAVRRPLAPPGHRAHPVAGPGEHRSDGREPASPHVPEQRDLPLIRTGVVT